MEPHVLKPHMLPSGYLLPTIHSYPPLFTVQRNVKHIASQTEDWTRIILSYAKYRRLFFLSTQNLGPQEGEEWSGVFHNPRIKRSLKQSQLEVFMQAMVENGQAAYEPVGQTSVILLFWRKPEEWAEELYSWASNTGQLNTILTLFEITSPEVPSPLVDLPLPLLRRSISLLSKSGRAQLIEGASGGGVRFFAK